mmetsp:Transcript_9608/g.23846  ORF Transcript_9608/g.23846 Transcript_9608/m.23846 type:complete len:311 (+) Transcript_9608:201-1133(+)
MPLTHLLLGGLVVRASGVALGAGMLHTRATNSRAHLFLGAESSFEAKLRDFAPAAELPTVRGELVRLQNQLQAAIDEQDFAAAAMLRDDITELRNKDPAVMSSLLKEQLQDALAKEDYKQASALRDQMLVLRRFLPQYQLAGLWKGNYPNHGEELVRIHYEGDTLYATKVTGDLHVPAGEVTFQADLSQPFDQIGRVGANALEEASGVRVEVVSLSSDGSQEQREVEQFQGEGRIAAVNFQHAHFVPGQLFLMDEDVLGFLWLPLGTFIVFSRVHEENECSPAAAAAAAAAYGQSATHISMDLDGDSHYE